MGSEQSTARLLFRTQQHPPTTRGKVSVAIAVPFLILAGGKTIKIVASSGLFVGLLVDADAGIRIGVEGSVGIQPCLSGDAVRYRRERYHFSDGEGC